MLRSLRSLSQLFRTARVLARHDALFSLEVTQSLPLPARIARHILRFGAGRIADDASSGERLSSAFEQLGPTYIKMGQFLATRADVVGPEIANDLAMLRDKLPAFGRAPAVDIIESDFQQPLETLFHSLGEPVAAASIAQVHKATVLENDGTEKTVAVKVLRPDAQARFDRELDAFFWGAEMVERFAPSLHRLRLVDVVQTLADSVDLEMDLRLEASALSEMAERSAQDARYRVPRVDWARTSKRVLTLEWVDAIPAADIEALNEAGIDLPQLATHIIQTFLTHALREGFFHADMHQGNMFVDPDGTLVAIDFGIMGRLDAKSRRVLAEILYGFVRQDYRRVAEVHFEAGYVPKTQDVDLFAQALRAIGEPIFGKSAEDVSMGRLLTQLFDTTGQFDMATRPELVLLQKTMVVVEGVARSFDPEHNIWDSAEPIVRQWIEQEMGLEARLQEAADSATALAQAAAELPEFLERMGRAARQVSDQLDEGGLRLHADTAKAIGKAEGAARRPSHFALWAIAAALGALAVTQIL